MERLELNVRSKNQITDYMKDNHLMVYEKKILQEMITAIEAGNQKHLDWFRSFGDTFRTITMNVYAYRKALEFGFTHQFW